MWSVVMSVSQTGTASNTAGKLFQASWGSGSSKEDIVVTSKFQSSSFGGPGVRYSRTNGDSAPHAFFFGEVAVPLVQMQYSSLNYRLGYRQPDKMMVTMTKAGFMPHWLFDHSIFNCWWNSLMNEVNNRTQDTEAVGAMMGLSSHVNDMMTLPPLISHHEENEAWLMASHRILHRLDLACHHADMAYLAIEDPKEERHAALRVMGLQHMAARSSSASSSYSHPPRGDGQRPFKRGKPDRSSNNSNKPLVYCEYHKKDVRHSPSECFLRPKASNGK